jgi:hypothetical protein
MTNDAVILLCIRSITVAAPKRRVIYRAATVTERTATEVYD